MKIFTNQLWVSVVFVLAAAVFNADAALIGHWTFDEGSGTTAFDSSGNGLNGAISNATYTVGKVGTGALDFNGSNAYVMVLNNALLVPETISIALWFRTTSPGYGQYADLLDKGHGHGSNPYFAGYVLQTNAGTGDFVAAYGNGSEFYGPHTDFSRWDGDWHHFVVNLGQDGCQLYIDGVLEDSSPGMGPLVQNDSNLYFGRHRTLGRYFLGSLDDIRIYDKALSQAEVRALYLPEPATLVLLGLGAIGSLRKGR